MQALQSILIVSGAELHRRYNVTTYRRVPAAKFAEVVTWLEGWLGTLAAGTGEE